MYEEFCVKLLLIWYGIWGMILPPPQVLKRNPPNWGQRSEIVIKRKISVPQMKIWGKAGERQEQILAKILKIKENT